MLITMLCVKGTTWTGESGHHAVEALSLRDSCLDSAPFGAEV